MSNRARWWPGIIAAGAIACGSDATSSSGTSLSGTTTINKSILISAAAPSLHQQETTLAQSGSRIVVVWIGTVSSVFTTIEYAISDDAGASWGAPAQIPIPQPAVALSDPGIVADDGGSFMLVALGDGPRMGVYAFRLAVGAKTFGTPVTVD